MNVSKSYYCHVKKSYQSPLLTVNAVGLVKCVWMCREMPASSLLYLPNHLSGTCFSLIVIISLRFTTDYLSQSVVITHHTTLPNLIDRMCMIRLKNCMRQNVSVKSSLNLSKNCANTKIILANKSGKQNCIWIKLDVYQLKANA